MRLLFYFLLFNLFYGCVVNKKNTRNSDANEIKVNKTGSISLLNRIRANPGIYIEGSGEDAKVYTKGINSINNQKEILFILNGVQVGNYSKVSKILNSTDIQNITILKNASDIAFYGFNGSGGVILIKTN